MKSFMGWALVASVFILASFRSAHVSDAYNLEAVTTAFRSGNVNKLSPYLAIRVDISLPGKSDTYSKSQAEMVISDFFNEHAVRNFTIFQQGESAGYLFCAGLLQTGSGNYRTTLFFKQQGGRQYLQEIRFQPVY